MWHALVMCVLLTSLIQVDCTYIRYRLGDRLTTDCMTWPYVTETGVIRSTVWQLIIPITYNYTVTCRRVYTLLQLMVSARFLDAANRDVVSTTRGVDVCDMVVVQSSFGGANLCADILAGPVDLAYVSFSVNYSHPLATSREWSDKLMVVTISAFDWSKPCRRGDVATYGEQCCYQIYHARKEILPENRRCDGNRCMSAESFCDGVPTCIDGTDEGLWCTPPWVWGYVGVAALSVLVGIPVVVVAVVRSRRSKSADKIKELPTSNSA